MEHVLRMEIFLQRLYDPRPELVQLRSLQRSDAKERQHGRIISALQCEGRHVDGLRCDLGEQAIAPCAAGVYVGGKAPLIDAVCCCSTS